MPEFTRPDGRRVRAIRYTGDNHDEVLGLLAGRYVKGGVTLRGHDSPGSPAVIRVEDAEGNLTEIVESETVVHDPELDLVAVYPEDSKSLTELVATPVVDLATPMEIALTAEPALDSLPVIGPVEEGV